MRFFVSALLRLVAVLAAAQTIVLAAVIDVRELGARGDGRTVNTASIQAAIDEAHRDGGGVVRVTDGVYVSGMLRLRSGVTLRVEEGAILRAAAPEEGAYESHTPKGGPAPASLGGTALSKVTGLIFARGQRDIAVEGRGVIDGNGLAFSPSEVRPSVLCFMECEDVRVSDITTRSSAYWTQNYVQCTGVEIVRVRVESHLPDRNNDGIDFVECHDVRLLDSTVIADDDAIVVKSNLTADRGSRNILVENCTVYGRKSAFKIGTETFGPFENITVRNLTAYGTRGINLYSVDGAQIRNVLIENVTIRDGYAALLMHVGDRRLFRQPGASGPPAPGGMENIVVRNLHATFAEKSFKELLDGRGIALHGPVHEKPMSVAENFISGLRGHPIANVRLENITLLNFPGGGTPGDVVERVPENSDHYPLQGMFGRLPAWALYLRNAHHVAIENLVLGKRSDDARPAVLADGVSELTIRAAVVRGERFEVRERDL